MLDDEDSEKRANFLPYPASTLSPQIIPNDLTSFKSRGVSKVEKTLKQQLTELREQYSHVIDEFNWNKLVYESQFGFEPIIGETYHLYEIRGKHKLTMIGPDEWKHTYIGSFRLDVDARWKVIEVAEGFCLEEYLEAQEGQ